MYYEMKGAQPRSHGTANWIRLGSSPLDRTRAGPLATRETTAPMSM